jgi:VWFA-related protein
MRLFLLLALGLGLLAVIPAPAQDPSKTAYEIDIDQQSLVSTVRDKPSKKGLYITLSFKVLQGPNLATDVIPKEIELREDDLKVEELEINQPDAQDLTTMLVIDVSGSMKNKNKMEEAKKAAQAFLDKLTARADSGLILFDHEIPLNNPDRVQRPCGKPENYETHRQKLRELIGKAEPLGGTAYLDATAEAITMLKDVKGRKAVLLLTDGVDMSSKRNLAMVVQQAKDFAVPIYTLGVGDPGKNEKVSTVLVLDHSNSMRGKANDKDRQSKMDALKHAAKRFVELMRPTAQTTLLPFSSTVDAPSAFSSTKKEKLALITSIFNLTPVGGTLLYDATLSGVETLLAARLTGRKSVVVLTDGKDESPGSRVSEDEVIERAKEADIPLYMLGLGRDQEINEKVMIRMAEETKGKYYHAENEAALIKIFEQLSIDLHDDGIDEESLKALAAQTGGKYFPARDASNLARIYEELAREFQSTYTVTFKSRKQSFDGTARNITIRVVRGDVAVSNEGSTGYAVRGVVVVPDMNQQTCLILFVFLGGLMVLLALPTWLGKQGQAKREA